MARVLIVAYGNPMRSDDGLAWHAADKLEGKYSPSEVEILRVHQLAPELAENVSRSEAVIFVDAAMADGANGIPGRSATPKSACLRARLVSRTSFLPRRLWRLPVNFTALAREHSR